MTKKKDPKDFKKNGRPSKYTIELGEEICDAIATSELGLAHLVEANPGWPHRANIFNWLRKHPEFRDNYYKAKEDQTEVCVEYMHEIMNEQHKYVDENGLVKIDVPMLKLKVETMKWHVGKLKPKKYGDIKVQEHVNTEVDEDCKKRFLELDERNKKDF